MDFEEDVKVINQYSGDTLAMLDDFEKENQDDDNEVLLIEKQYESDSDEPAYIQEIDDSVIISYMNLVVAKADTVETFDGNNLSS